MRREALIMPVRLPYFESNDPRQASNWGVNLRLSA